MTSYSDANLIYIFYRISFGDFEESTGLDARQGCEKLSVVFQVEVGVVELGDRLRVVEQKNRRKCQDAKLSVHT